MKVVEIIDDKVRMMSKEIAQRYVKLIELSTKTGNISWKEYISENIEQYVVELEEFNILAYLCYDAGSEQLSLYVEDTEYNQYYLCEGKE